MFARHAGMKRDNVEIVNERPIQKGQFTVASAAYFAVGQDEPGGQPRASGMMCSSDFGLSVALHQIHVMMVHPLATKNMVAPWVSRTLLTWQDY